MPSLNISNAIMTGLDFRRRREEEERQQQARNLLGGLMSGGLSPNQLQSQQFQQLAQLNPGQAAQFRNMVQSEEDRFNRLSRERQTALFQDAQTVNELLKSGNVTAAQNLLGERGRFIQALGGNPADTQEIATLLANGDIEQARRLLDDVVTIGQTQGFIEKPTAQSLSANQKELQTLIELRQKAAETGDPADIALAEQFANQAGFNRLSPEEQADLDVDTATRKALQKQASDASRAAFDNLKQVRTAIGNMDDAIKAIDSGAETGPIISRLPSFRESSILLDNIRGRMGLDVIGGTTFGALSESELQFALDTALPTNLEPAALKQWLIDKRSAQRKLAKELRDAASFLGRPGNTIADYLEKVGAAAQEASDTGVLTPEEEEELKRLEQKYGG